MPIRAGLFSFTVVTAIARKRALPGNISTRSPTMGFALGLFALTKAQRRP
jgi:hypothetical protein